MTQPLEPFVGTYTMSEWDHVTICGDARVEWLPPGDSRRPTYDGEPDKSLVRVYLHSGSLRRYQCEDTDEGHSYEHEVISEGEVGDRPAWVIETENGGKDCDGAHARHWEGYSTGGLTDGAWYSPSTELSSSVYDQFAQMAGY